MDAKPQLILAAETFAKFDFDPVIIGNAAAALNGAPVTTLDIDYLIENSPENYRKIMAIASCLHCEVFELKISEPNVHYVYRLQDASRNLAFDILHQASGVSVETVRRNARTVEIEGHAIKVAALEDVIASKKAAGREKDRAVLPVLMLTLSERDMMARQGQNP